VSGSSDIFARLAAPFPPDEVEWRVGSTNKRAWERAPDNNKPKRWGLPLCYIDARMVMDRLDEVLGPDGWQCEYTPMPNGTTCCRIGIRRGDYRLAGLAEGTQIFPDWIWKANGAGATGDTGKADEREMAEKGAYSDAFKRAGVLFGIGRYLYAIKAPWVELDQKWQIPQAEHTKLAALLARNGAPPKSARQAHKDGDYSRLETALREAKTLKALFGVWKDAQETIKQWPDRWIEAATEEKDACKAKLEGDDPRKARAASQAPLQDQRESRA
jgi:hypothetical protein